MAAIIFIALVLLVGYVTLARIYHAGRATIALGKMLTSHDSRDRAWAYVIVGSVFFLIVMSAAVGIGWAITILVAGGILSAGGWVAWRNYGSGHRISSTESVQYGIAPAPPSQIGDGNPGNVLPPAAAPIRPWEGPPPASR